MSAAECAMPRRARHWSQRVVRSRSPPGPSSGRHVCGFVRAHAGMSSRVVPNECGERDAFVHPLQELESPCRGGERRRHPRASTGAQHRAATSGDAGGRRRPAPPRQHETLAATPRTDARPEQVAPLPAPRPVRPRGPRRTDASAPARPRSRRSRTPARRRSNRGTAPRCERRTSAHGCHRPASRANRLPAPPTSERPPTPQTDTESHMPTPRGGRTTTPSPHGHDPPHQPTLASTPARRTSTKRDLTRNGQPVASAKRPRARSVAFAAVSTRRSIGRGAVVCRVV